jgi:UDP-N-acetylmuramyl pentapeptide phosphotransferase/UDP-N-acetylglucosamine-1-phosphate transferase
MLGAAMAAAACLFTLIACELLRRFAIRRALLDGINERSLHSIPTPRLGGVAIVLAVLSAAAASASWSEPHTRALLFIGALIAAVGLRDDLRPLSASARIIIQIGAAALFLALVGVPPLLFAFGRAFPLPSAAVAILLVVWIVGVLNIYNFMDGMDGLAGFQTCSAAIALATSGEPSLAMGAAMSGSALGFLAHNYPPARIFMGDAGSTFIGFTFAAFGVIGLHHGVPLTLAALALAPFLLDGTFTIIRRARRRERIWQAHRSHLYQRAVQSGLGHREVLLVYMGWMCIAAGSACAAIATKSNALMFAGWGAALVGLVVVWRWVVHLESKCANLT